MAEIRARGYQDKSRSDRNIMPQESRPVPPILQPAATPPGGEGSGGEGSGARPLFPEMVRFRAALAAGYAAHPPLHTLPIAAARAVAEAVRAPWSAGGPAMHRSRDVTVSIDGASLRLRIHLPVPEPDGILAYVHGGGWTLFSLDTHDRLMREYAARGRLAVVGIDYTLAPEARFPRPVREVASVLRLLGDQERAGALLGFDTAGLGRAVGGDSAGGNLSMAASLMLRDAGGAALPDAIVMNYGVVDPDASRPSYALYDGPDYNLERDEMRAFWDGYADMPDRSSPYATLLRGALHGMPPTLLAVAECDVLRDENLALADALRQAGVAVELRVYDGMLHSFLEAVSISPTAVRALQETADWLRSSFGLPPLVAMDGLDVRS